MIPINTSQFQRSFEINLKRYEKSDYNHNRVLVPKTSHRLIDLSNGKNLTKIRSIAWFTDSIAKDKGKVANSHEKTSAAAAPRKPKNGAVSSPLKVEDIFAGADGTAIAWLDRIGSDRIGSRKREGGRSENQSNYSFRSGFFFLDECDL